MAFSARLHEYNCANAIVRLGGRYTPLEKVTVFRGTTDQNLQRSIDFERRTPTRRTPGRSTGHSPQATAMRPGC